VKRLYEDLWAKVGSPNPLVLGSRVLEVMLHEVFPPITVEDISERIKKIKNKTAAGPDSLQKKHLSIPGLPIIMAKLCNILCFSSYFPTIWWINRTTLIPKVNKNGSKVENWRPITISQNLGRLFSSILDGRLRKGIVQNLR
jgi:hypothetical protein